MFRVVCVFEHESLEVNEQVRQTIRMANKKWAFIVRVGIREDRHLITIVQGFEIRAGALMCRIGLNFSGTSTGHGGCATNLYPINY